MSSQTLLARHLRRVKGLTLDDVGGSTGIDITTLSRIERGKIPGTEAQRNAIAGYFGRPIESLLSAAPVFDEASA